MAFIAATPDGRRQIGKALKGLGEGLSEYARQGEAEKRRAAALEAAQERLTLIQAMSVPSPSADPKPSAVPDKDADARWREVVIPPGVVLILGKRGSGKSALAYRLLELFRYRLSPHVVGAPAQGSKLLPEWIGTVPTLEDLPPDSIALAGC